jgi:hypothetical protein
VPTFLTFSHFWGLGKTSVWRLHLHFMPQSLSRFLGPDWFAAGRGRARSKHAGLVAVTVIGKARRTDARVMRKQLRERLCVVDRLIERFREVQAGELKA